jgi:phospholipase D1/2
VKPSPLVRVVRSGRWLLLGLYLTLFVCLTLAWRDPIWRQYLEPHALAKMGRDLVAMPMGPVLVLAGYIVAVVLAVPVGVLVVVGALVFGPWPGMLYTLCGMVSGAVVTYGIGYFTAGVLVEGLRGRPGIDKLSRALKKRGLSTIIVVRVVPLAPFVMVNMTAGAFKVSMRDYVLGSFIGLMPATIMASLFADRLAAVFASPDVKTFAMLVVVVVGLVGVIWWLKSRFSGAEVLEELGEDAKIQ